MLQLPRVGPQDDFFALGGHSLLATRVVSRVREAFGAELPVRALFEAATVERLAARVQAALAEAGDAPPPLVPVPRGGPLPLSFAQQRLWFLWQVDPGSSAYVMPGALRLRGTLDAAALRASLGEVVRRHEALRTVFPAVEGRPVQVVLDPAPLPLPVADLRGLDAAAREAGARRLAAESAARPFDLERGPLLRAALVRLGDEEWLLLFAMHHAVGDGWSTGVLVREASALYRAFARGEASPLPELPVQYADYAAWERAWLTDEVLEAELAFWRGAMAGAPPLLELPLDRPRPPVPDPRGARHAFILPAEAGVAVRELCREKAATPFMVALAAWQLLLARYAGEEDVVVGTPVAGRTRTELEGLVGLFVNTLPLRADLAGRPSFRELLRRTRRATLEAFAHQHLPFERLVDELRVERSLTHAPLFQTLFVFGGAAPEWPSLGDVRVEAWDGEGEGAKFDLTLEATWADGGLTGALAYRTGLFHAATVERIAGHFGALLASASADPGAPAWELPLLGAAEREALVWGWNATATGHTGVGCVHELFEAQAARTPHAVALVAGAVRVTYAELDRLASSLAARLRELGVGPEVRVGVCTGRTPELVVAVLAALKAGGAYLPLDPAYPAERLRFLVEDTSARLVLTTAALRGRLHAGVETVLVEDALPHPRAPAPPLPVSPECLAYVVHTSGSTGTPKGVMVEHRGLAN
ncbi:MAG TPA: condensation domain-containing protein, partial [Longimicrobiaceae bacterium]|nr:condensation domain-containing protein [Longimicrobiaceae bacterium]